MKGIINVLKPPGMTSHDTVHFIRKNLKIKKVGHTGTLDPNAAGVLPICIGKATKISQYLINKDKSYRVELTLGKQTDTQDKYGKIVNKSNNKTNKDQIIKVMNSFIGESYQTPPMYSALKHKGKKLYEIARKGKTINRKKRKISIYDINIVRVKDNKYILFDVSCSKGTYIRTLCNDIGIKLNVYGYMSFLLRTKVGVFNLKDSLMLEQIANMYKNGLIGNIIKPIDYPLVDYNNITVKNSNYKKITNGVKIPINQTDLDYNIDNTDDKYKIYCKGKFIGMGTIKKYQDKSFLKMEKVLI